MVKFTGKPWYADIVVNVNDDTAVAVKTTSCAANEQNCYHDNSKFSVNSESLSAWWIQF